MKCSILLLAAAAAGVVAAPASQHKLHERRDFIPSAWSEERRLDGSTLLPVRIGLAQSNLDHGHDLLMQMYDHPSPYVLGARSLTIDYSGRTLHPVVTETT